MPKKRARFLPKYVSSYADRHGKKRYRYRRKGYEGGHFTADLGTEAFREQYAVFERGPLDRREGIDADRHAPGSVAAIVARFCANPTRLGPTKVTQHKVRSILGRFVDRYGSGKNGPRYIADFTFEHIDSILEKEREKRPEGTRMIGGVEAARKLRKELVRLFTYAEKLGIRPVGSNPVRLAEQVRVSASEGRGGHHPWSDAEIDQYQAHHPLGTMARLALELFVWTGQRRGDVYKFGPKDVQSGRFDFMQGKGGKPMMLPLAPQLVTAITAMPKQDAETFLLTSHGKPYSYAGFGNQFRVWCNEAGLPHCSAHGLRKATARRLAEIGATQQMLKAVGGWSQDREVATYVADADQARLASQAMTSLSDWEANRVANRLSNRGPEA